MSVSVYASLARPRQWVKNGFVLTGLLFGHALGDPAMAWAAVAATAAFCLVSSAVYAMNDCFDRARDREHPEKRNRPIASGAIPVRSAAGFGALLAAAGFALGALAGPLVPCLLIAYVVLNIGYSSGLKRIAVVDVAIIATGFMLRILAGTLGIGIEPSRWLLLCGFMVTLFLGFAKRRAELGHLASGAGSHRPVLDAYSESFLDGAVLACAAGMLACYGFYTVSPDTVAQHGTDLVLTVPFVLFGTFRYLYLLRHRGGGGDPSGELVGDPWLLASAVGWVTTVALLIG